MQAEIRRSIVYRSERGKTVRLCISVRGDRIMHATFTGDFFGEPAEELNKIGESIVGLSIKERDKLLSRLDAFLRERVEWIEGVSPEDFKQALVKILENL
ncbi:MAG: hypothetical protein LZ166_00570 [Thaumarchaeota archaeon]|nr:hypothetical protein [Nitrososphaerota archaeon]MCL7386008.1 hypothetical protein [Candidatus Wolframiiraptor allenii]